MDVSVVEDVVEFAELAGPVLARDPQRHTVPLTVLGKIRYGGAPVAVMLVARDGGVVVGVALRTPGRALLVAAMPLTCVDAVADMIGAVDPEVPGVSGPVPEAEVFAQAIGARTGCRVAVGIRTRLFVLDGLVEPSGVVGRVRRAGEPDVELLARWRREFATEAHAGLTDPESPHDKVRRSLQLGSAEMLWEVDGVPVAQASVGAVQVGTSRVGPVYTSPEHRRRGYGAAVTAAASRWALDAGADRVLLFTDLANPTTNALYPRIGYRPVCDMIDLDLIARPTD